MSTRFKAAWLKFISNKPPFKDEDTKIKIPVSEIKRIAQHFHRAGASGAIYDDVKSALGDLVKGAKN